MSYKQFLASNKALLPVIRLKGGKGLKSGWFIIGKGNAKWRAGKVLRQHKLLHPPATPENPLLSQVCRKNSTPRHKPGFIAFQFKMQATASFLLKNNTLS